MPRPYDVVGIKIPQPNSEAFVFHTEYRFVLELRDSLCKQFGLPPQLNDSKIGRDAIRKTLNWEQLYDLLLLMERTRDGYRVALQESREHLLASIRAAAGPSGTISHGVSEALGTITLALNPPTPPAPLAPPTLLDAAETALSVLKAYANELGCGYARDGLAAAIERAKASPAP